MLKSFILSLVLFCTVLISGCTGLPQNITPVDNFSLERYQGKWYEIARLDHSFEQGLSNVTAHYTLNEDGSVTVQNQGFNDAEQQWSKAQGKAKFVENADIGHLKVSFFGPFYSSYVVFKMDKQYYQYAYVAGYNTDYLWLLSRTPSVSQARKDDFIKTVKQRGFDATSLIWVEQNTQP
ncbi:lipocalin family protein [Pseudoalteromonas shioyasakiensis]|uniref:lipocalin family protein n=1 Tax=Pseudoalteromonas shioyasakiensis TaxID=1190813 RepID=UPI002117D957|nr:lipocalin family protein [Pseudoalteromonas shioyasakiensis]MCQ8878262.1 lipocalin family protein [Pseudoalteromonas shioyasakiensis]